MLRMLFDVYSLIILASVVLSWIQLPPDNPIVRITSALTEPLLAPIRRMLPATGGFDFSPLVLLFALNLLRRVLLG